ncbi:unnamed protein product [Cochlearia groenlandica]
MVVRDLEAKSATRFYENNHDPETRQASLPWWPEISKQNRSILRSKKSDDVGNKSEGVSQRYFRVVIVFVYHYELALKC